MILLTNDFLSDESRNEIADLKNEHGHGDPEPSFDRFGGISGFVKLSSNLISLHERVTVATLLEYLEALQLLRVLLVRVELTINGHGDKRGNYNKD